jgi:hypothetical protein
MKTGQFDELIRKKLESLPQKFTDQEIDKVYTHVVSQKKPFFRHVRGSGLIYSVLVAAFTGLIIWQLMKDNPEKTVMTTTEGVSISGSEVVHSLPDTSFLSSKTESGSTKKQLIENNEKVSVTAIPKEKIQKIHIQSQDTITKGKYIPVPVTVVTKFDSIPVNRAQISKDKPNKPLIIKEETNITDKVSHATDSSLIQKISIPMDVIIEENVVSDPIVKVQKETKSEPVKDEKTIQPKKQRSSGNNANWDFAGGMEAGIANGYVRGAVIGELTFRSHWVFRTGFGIQKLDQEKFKDENAYEKHKSHHFKHEYDGHFDEHDRITQIKSNRYLLQIPVSFHYLFLLKNNYTLSAGIGTDLDIYNHLKVDFRRSTSTDSIGRIDQFTKSEQTKLLNNLVITAGLQKKWNWFSVGIQPYIAAQLQEVRYKDKTTYFGADIQFLYHFGINRKRK